MAARTYICTVSNDNTEDRQYFVRTRSAMVCAKEYGLYAGNDTITVRTHSGQILSKVRWDEESKKYINVSF